MRFRLATLLLALAALCSACLGSTVYSQSITSSTSSLTITHTQHGFSSNKLAVTVVDGNGNQVATTAFSYSINASTYDVSLTFNPAVSSGAVKIIGTYANNTSASTDWQVTRVFENGVNNIYVCYYCTSSVPAIRTTNGKSYVSEGWVRFHYNSGNLSHAYVYLSDNVVVMGVNSGGVSIDCSVHSTSVAGGGCRTEYAASFPSGVIQLGDMAFSSGTFQGVTDDRPIDFQ